MKKLTIIAVCLCFALSVNAQWYFNSYNVTNMNELSKEQLNLSLEKANKSIKTGQTLTVIGGIGCVIGGIIYSSGLSDITESTTYSEIDNGLNKGMTGIYIMYAGGIMATVGIPIWISGFTRKEQIEIALVKFQTTGYIPEIGIKLTF